MLDVTNKKGIKPNSKCFARTAAAERQQPSFKTFIRPNYIRNSAESSAAQPKGERKDQCIIYLKKTMNRF
jgi:hypothetical protein